MNAETIVARLRAEKDAAEARAQAAELRAQLAEARSACLRYSCRCPTSLGPATRIGTDNKASYTIRNGVGCPTRSKHFLRRYLGDTTVAQRIASEEVRLEHMPDEQTARRISDQMDSEITNITEVGAIPSVCHGLARAPVPA